MQRIDTYLIEIYSLDEWNTKVHCSLKSINSWVDGKEINV
jgi:hypothetical protein